LLAYFDESEQPAEVLPAASISAITGTGLQWVNFNRGWDGVLEEYQVVDKHGRRVFHTTDFETPEGRLRTCYEQWPDEKRKEFSRRLLDVIASSGIRANASTLIVDEYIEVAKRFTASPQVTRLETADQFKVFENHYCFLALFAMLFAAKEAGYFPKGSEMAYFFEAGGNYQHFVGLLYNTMLLEAPLAEHFRFASKPNFVAKDFAYGLQAADKIAYESSKHASHFRDLNPPLKYAEVIEGDLRWKTRYALIHLYERGLDVRMQHWRKGDLEMFFHLRQEHDDGDALTTLNDS